MTRSSAPALLVALLLLLLPPALARTSAAPAPLANPPDFAAIDAYVATQMRAQHIPGVAVGIVHRDAIMHLRGFGVAGPGGEPVTPQTPFSIGSLTKSFTAVAVMQLVETGQLELDAPVQRYLSWFRVTDTTASAQLTLRHLLTHTSGLPRDLETPAAATMADGPDQLERAVRSLVTVALEQPVGHYGYSNIGYQVLALVIDRVASQPYADYVRQQLFAPLAMHHSFATLDEAAQHGMASGHSYWFGHPVAVGVPHYRRGPGNGGLFASAEDMAHYLIAHLNDGRAGTAALLSPAGMAELHRPAIARGADFYAMGWGVRTLDGMTVLAHSGQSYSYFARMMLVPDRGWGVIVLQNAHSPLQILTDHQSEDVIADGVVQLLRGQPLPARPVNVALPLLYGSLGVLLVVQLASIARAVRRLRGWSAHPARRPQGWRGCAWHIALPALGAIGWAGLMACMPPVFGGFALATSELPDLIYLLLTSGLIALVWGITRLVWASWLVRHARSHMGARAGTTG